MVHTSLDVYREIAEPAGIDRLGVRYLNRINIPGQTIRLKDYFRVYPERPEELQAAPGPFLLSLPIRPVYSGHQLTLNLGLGPPERPDVAGILLDIYDVLPLGGKDVFGEVQRWLDESHANIVYTFENAITDMSRGLFGGGTHE